MSRFEVYLFTTKSDMLKIIKMRHSIQNKAFYIFDMAKKIYIKTRHAHMSRFDLETESRDLKEHTKHK